MHISEGILSGTVLVSGALLAVAASAVGLKKLDYERIPQAGVLSACFFVASLIHVPLAAASVHLILNGLVGLMLGWGAFPVILVALVLQAAFFQFGGLTTLGVNTVIMALPAVVCFHIFGRLVLKNTSMAVLAAFGCGFCSVFLASLIMALALFLTGEEFVKISLIVVMAHLPVMIVEGMVTAFCVAFLKKVQPAMLSRLEVAGETNAET
ncbi:MAG: cobalt transporter CbiM [Proteobacteria bacterium]|nr:cobalt transporter CbiM [Pseudomonadota bacterium]